MFWLNELDLSIFPLIDGLEHTIGIILAQLFINLLSLTGVVNDNLVKNQLPQDIRGKRELLKLKVEELDWLPYHEVLIISWVIKLRKEWVLQYLL